VSPAGGLRDERSVCAGRVAMTAAEGLTARRHLVDVHGSLAGVARNVHARARLNALRRPQGRWPGPERGAGRSMSRAPRYAGPARSIAGRGGRHAGPEGITSWGSAKEGRGVGPGAWALVLAPKYRCCRRSCRCCSCPIGRCRPADASVRTRMLFLDGDPVAVVLHDDLAALP